MKAIQKLISLITVLTIAAALCACANQDKPDIPEDTQSIAPIADEAEPEITLEYFYTSHLSEDNYMTDEDKPPEEYLKESLLTNERYMCRYFVKLYETDYSEEELIEKVYPGDWRTGIPPKNLPKPICTTTRCPDGEIPTKPYESNFLPEGSEIHIQDPYAGCRFAAAVYDTDDGKKMTILRYTYFAYNDEYGAPVPLSRAPQAVCVDEVKKYSPVMYVTTGDGDDITYRAECFAARYYSDSPDVTKAQLDEILKGAEYAGEIKRVESRNMNVISISESNFLPVGTEIYTLGKEAIAVLPEPHLHEESGRYIVAMKLFKSGSRINYADAVKLINGDADDSNEFIVLPESRKNEDDNPADLPIADPQPEEETDPQDDIPESSPNVDIYATTDLKLGFISMSFVNLVDYDEFDEWINSTSSSVSEYTSVAEAANLYSFIKRFEIPEDKVREILISERNGNEDEDFSDDDIDILLSGDNEAIAEHFAADTAIRKGENLYSIYWMQNHTAEDYTAAGITDKDIAAIPALAEALQNKEQTSAQTTVPESEPQSKATEDISTTDNLSADSVITLPGGKTIKISDIERVVLFTNNPMEPDPEVTDTEDIIKVLSALNEMKLGELEAGGWVGGNTIVIYSGGERFSQIAIGDDEIFLVDSLDDNTKGVYPVISGGLSYDEWKALFGANDE